MKDKAFNLIYLCTNCRTMTPAQTVDGVVTGPPDICLVCTTINPNDIQPGVRGAGGRRRVGDIFKGLQLDYYNKGTSKNSEWRCLCLFCKQYTIVSNNNINVQLSCGCLKSYSTLKIEFFYPFTEATNAKVRCTCRECGLTSDYLLMDDEPIVCRSGCIKEVVR